MSMIRPLAFVLGALALSAAGEAAQFSVDAAHTEVGFNVRHILTRVHGRFREFEGTFTFDEKAPEKSSGTFTAKAVSVDTNNEKRDAHLRTGDFFEVEKHPELVLVTRKFSRTAEGRFRLEGHLTIRGVTKPVTFDVDYLGTEKTPWGSRVVAFEARTKILRKDFGVVYGLDKVMESGALLVSNEVEIVLAVEAVEQGAAPKKK